VNNENIIVNNEKVDNALIIKIDFYLLLKRITDIFFSILGILALIPLILIIKIVYIVSGDFNSIFYSHERIGKNGKPFKMFKFRAMVMNSQEILEELLKDKNYKKEWEENHKFENDPRITKVGDLLRKTSLDEIPQIINILKGDMSIIGPRPMLQEEVDAYGKNKDKLLSMRPGLTGWWACNGRSCTTAKKRKELELYYIDNCSLLLDIKIIFKTLLAVIKRDGAK
jgi:undecaprenyl-phosphate galactose phosphotransferase